MKKGQELGTLEGMLIGHVKADLANFRDPKKLSDALKASKHEAHQEEFADLAFLMDVFDSPSPVRRKKHGK